MKRHYHVIRTGPAGEEYREHISSKAQARQAAKNQALTEAHRLGRKPVGNLECGWIFSTGYMTVSYNIQSCSQEPCTAGGR